VRRRGLLYFLRKRRLLRLHSVRRHLHQSQLFGLLQWQLRFIREVLLTREGERNR
jgi:hypothetical protein